MIKLQSSHVKLIVLESIGNAYDSYSLFLYYLSSKKREEKQLNNLKQNIIHHLVTEEVHIRKSYIVINPGVNTAEQ